MLKHAASLLALCILFLLAGLLPAAISLFSTLSDGPALTSFITGFNLRAFFNTMVMGLAVGLSACVAGFTIAYTIVNTKGFASKTARTIFPIALFAPSVMPAIGLIYLIGNNGLIIQTPLYGATGVFLGALVFTLPHATLQLLLSLERLDAGLILAARSLGASPLKGFLTIILPHCRAGLINAFLIAFVLTVTDFGVPKLLGGSFSMLATEIYNQAIGNQDWAAAGFLSLWLMLPCILAFYFTSKYPMTVAQPGDIPARPFSEHPIGWSIAAWLFLIFEASCVLVVIYGSFVTFWPYVPEMTLANYSFKNSTYGIDPWINSFILATSVATIGTIVSFVGAYLTRRVKNIPPALTKLFSATALLPLCIPGTVLGLAFALAFSGCSIFSSATGAMTLLVFNTLIHLYTVAHITAGNTFNQIDPRYETVGDSLGVSPLSTIRQVILPLCKTGLGEVFCYLFASALTTISAVVFLYTPETMPAAVAAIQMIDSGFISEGAAMSTLIFASALAVRMIVLKISQTK